MLNINEPTDQRLVSELPSFIRANRSAINALISSSLVTITNLDVSGMTVLFTGTQLNSTSIEIVFMSNSLVTTLQRIEGGLHGQLKLFVIRDPNISFTDGIAGANGQLYLNQLPALSTFNSVQGDILCMMNVGGTALNHGHWIEVFRTLTVK